MITSASTRTRTLKPGHYVAPRKTLVFAGLFLMMFFTVGAWSFIRSLEPLLWKKIPCTVTQIELSENPDSKTPFGAVTSFHFQWDGHAHQGTRLGIPGWEDSQDAWREILRIENNPDTICYLPHGDPARAVLLRPRANSGGLAFVGFAVLIGWILLLADRYRDESTDRLFGKVALPFMLLFGLPGVLLLFHLSVPVWVESIQARSWQETPATVVWSRIRHSTSGGRNRTTTQRADICYEYRAAGRAWRQNRIHPGSLKVNTQGGGREMLTAHPPGKQVRCFVDPANPARAVLIPKSGALMLFTLFPLPFIAVPAIVLRAVRKSKRTRRSSSGRAR